MPYNNLSLADFVNLPNADLMSRAKSFLDYTDCARSMHHYQVKRVACDGSKPLRKVLDMYTGEIREMIYLASNDYLNLTQHPKVIVAGREALETYGSGAGSVPLLGGTIDLHIELEKKIAKFKRCESALIYTSGFGSNAGTILAMLQQDDIAILDMFVHASIIDGCMNTNVKFFRHNNLNSLEKILINAQKLYRTKLVVVDGVYSMDGDIAPLDKIIELAKHYGAYVMVDEAHATGVIGKNGRGTPEYCGVEGEVDIVAGTFSKALGNVGGFIASNKALIELLSFYSRTYMFSTAMTPQAAGSLIAALDVIEDEPEHRQRLWENITYFRKNLLDLGFDLGNSETAIFPIIIGDDYLVKEMGKMLHEMNIYVNPVLYPAVPKRLARIRISLMSAHTKAHLDSTLNALEHIKNKLRLSDKSPTVKE